MEIEKMDDTMEGPEEGEIYDSLEDISSEDEQENSMEITCSKTNKMKKINYFTTKRKNKNRMVDDENDKSYKKALLNKTSHSNINISGSDEKLNKKQIKSDDIERRHRRKYSRSFSRSISLSPECTCSNSPNSFSSSSISPNYRSHSNYKRIKSYRKRSRSPYYRNRSPNPRRSRSPLKYPRSPKYKSRRISPRSPENVRYLRLHHSESPEKFITKHNYKKRHDKIRKKFNSKKNVLNNKEENIKKEDSKNTETPKLKKRLLNAGFFKEDPVKIDDSEKLDNTKTKESTEEDLEILRSNALKSHKINSPLDSPLSENIISKPTSPLPLTKSPIEILNCNPISNPEDTCEDSKQLEYTNSNDKEENKKMEEFNEILDDPYDPSDDIRENDIIVPLSIMNEDEEVLQLRMAALKSAVLFKHEKRKQKKNENISQESESKKASLKHFSSPDHTLVDMDIASDEGEGRIEDSVPCEYYYSNMNFTESDPSLDPSYSNFSLHQMLPPLPTVDPATFAQTTAAFVAELKSQAKNDPHNINVLKALNIQIPENTGYPIPIIRSNSPDLRSNYDSRSNTIVKKHSPHLRPNLIQLVNNSMGNSYKESLNSTPYNPEEDEEKTLRAALLQSLEKNNNIKKPTSSLSSFSAASPTSEGPYSPSGDVVMPIHTPPSTPSSTSLQIPTTPYVESPLAFSTIQPQQSFLPKRNDAIPLTNQPVPTPEVPNSNLLNSHMTTISSLASNNSLPIPNQSNSIPTSDSQMISEKNVKNKQLNRIKGNNPQTISNLQVTFNQQTNINRFVICLNTDSESEEEVNSNVNTDFEKCVDSFLKKAREDAESKTTTNNKDIYHSNTEMASKTILNKMNMSKTNDVSKINQDNIKNDITSSEIKLQKVTVFSKPTQTLSTMETRVKTQAKISKWNKLLINKNSASILDTAKIKSNTSKQTLTPLKTKIQSTTVKTTPLALRHLPPTKQQEYRQLKAKLIALETKKLAKLTAEKKAATLASSPKELRLQLMAKFKKDSVPTITSKDVNKNLPIIANSINVSERTNESDIKNHSNRSSDSIKELINFKSSDEIITVESVNELKDISVTDQDNKIKDIPLKNTYCDIELSSPNTSIENTNKKLLSEDKTKESSPDEIKILLNSDKSENIHSNSLDQINEENSSPTLNISPSDSSNVSTPSLNRAAKILLQAKKKLLCSKEKPKDKVEIISKENKENIKEDKDNNSEELAKAERDLLNNRTNVIEHLTLLTQQILDLENKQKRERDLSNLVSNLTLKLREVENRLTKQKILNHAAKLKMANCRRFVTQERSKCVALTKKCLTIGINVKGREYRVPSEGAELIMEKMEEVGNYTKRLKGGRLTSQCQNNTKKNLNISKQLKNVKSNIKKNNEDEISKNTSDNLNKNPEIQQNTCKKRLEPQPEASEAFLQNDLTKTNLAKNETISSPLKKATEPETSNISMFNILQPEEKNTSSNIFKPYKSPLEYLNTYRVADPNAFLCPYQLSGRCIDDACGYQHCGST